MTSKKRNFMLTLLGAVLILLAFAVLYQRQAGQKGFPEPLSATEFKLNTVVTITLYDSDDPSILEGAFALCSTNTRPCSAGPWRAASCTG